MRILMVSDTYHPNFDGIVRYLDYLIPELLSKGAEISIACPNQPNSQNYASAIKGLEISRCWTTNIKKNAYYLALPDFHLFREVRKADVVVIHSLMPLGVFGGFFAKLFNKKIALFCHHDERVILQDILKVPNFITQILFLLMKKYYGKIIDIFFHATERFKRKLQWFEVASEKINYVPFAINFSSTKFNGDFNLHKRYNIPSNAVVATYLGRLSIEKNVDTIIKAIDLAMNELPNLFGLIIGSGPDEGKFINQHCQNADRFIFTGFIPEQELSAHYNISDIFVTPTLNESSCFTVFEAMSNNVPVIIAEKDHDLDIVHEHNALLISNVLNHEEIKKNILLLARNKELRQKIAFNAYQLISSRTWENHANKFLECLEKISMQKSEKEFFTKLQTKTIQKNLYLKKKTQKESAF